MKIDADDMKNIPKEKIPPKEYCVIDKIQAFSDDKCMKKDASVKEEALKNMAKAWTKAAHDFKHCQPVEGEDYIYQKVECSKTHLTVAKYTDLACEDKAKDSNDKEVQTRLDFGNCKAAGGKSYMFSVKAATAPADKAAKFFKAGAAALLALAASQF